MTIFQQNPNLQRTITGLTAGTLYRFRVRARNANGYGPYSAWSTPGTPTPGTPAPPPSTQTLTVSASGRFRTVGNLNLCQKASLYTAVAEASAQLSGGSDGSLLTGVTYTWQGRYLRTATLNYGPSSPDKGWSATASRDPTWIDVAPAYIASDFNCDSTKAYSLGQAPLAGSAPLFLRAWLNNGLFPPHFWELRCVATGVVLKDGQTVNVTGTSRTIPFKELWGYDFPTTLMPLR